MELFCYFHIFTLFSFFHHKNILQNNILIKSTRISCIFVTDAGGQCLSPDKSSNIECWLSRQAGPHLKDQYDIILLHPFLLRGHIKLKLFKKIKKNKKLFLIVNVGIITEYIYIIYIYNITSVPNEHCCFSLLLILWVIFFYCCFLNDFQLEMFHYVRKFQ